MSDNFVELIGNIGSGFGLSKASCRLYALLYIKAKPLSLSRMAEELGMSKGNASLHIRALERWGAVKKVWKKGSRKDYYAAEEDLEKILISRFGEGIGRKIEMLRDYIENPDESANKKQLAKLEAQIKKAENLLNLLSRGPAL